MKKYTQLKNELLQDTATQKGYVALESEYQLINAVIEKRLQQKMSQKDLARKIGTQQSAIARFESGSTNPSVKFLQRMAIGLNATLHISLS